MAADLGNRPVLVTGLGVTSAFGRGTAALREGLWDGRAAFAPVRRFDARGYRTEAAATLSGASDLDEELRQVVEQACAQAGLAGPERASTPLLFARHPDPALARLPLATQRTLPTSLTASRLAAATGLQGAVRTYTNACTAASSAVAEAAASIRAGVRDRAVVAAGYLVAEDDFALFSAGRALASDGMLRPFSARRRGLLLGDGVGAVVLESAAAAAARGVHGIARLAGWGLAGDAHHVCQPHPEGLGLARAVEDALTSAGLAPADIGYVNAHGTGTPRNDTAEAAALHRVFGPLTGGTPVSSTKALHGHSLAASGVLELVATVLAVSHGELPVNANHLGPDPSCRLDLVLGGPRRLAARHALSLNAAFGGANTALVVSAV